MFVQHFVLEKGFQLRVVKLFAFCLITVGGKIKKNLGHLTQNKVCFLFQWLLNVKENNKITSFILIGILSLWHGYRWTLTLATVWQNNLMKSLFCNKVLKISCSILNIVVKVKSRMVVWVPKAWFLLNAYGFHTTIK